MELPSWFSQVVWNPFDDIVPRNRNSATENVVLFDGADDEARGKKKKNLVRLSCVLRCVVLLCCAVVPVARLIDSGPAFRP